MKISLKTRVTKRLANERTALMIIAAVSALGQITILGLSEAITWATAFLGATGG